MKPEQLRAVIAENVRTRRQSLGLSLATLGAAVDVTHSRMSQLEHARGSVPCDLLAKVAEALETEPSVLLTPHAFASKKKSMAHSA